MESVVSTTDGDLPQDRAEKHFEQAKKLSSVGKGTSVEAERVIREIYKAESYLQSHDVAHFLFLGKMYRQQLDISSAITCYRVALKEHPANLVAKKLLYELLIIKGQELMLLARKMNSLIKYHAARACFDEALEMDKDNVRLLILKTVCHVHAQELTEAFEAINKVIKPAYRPTAEMYILRAKIYWGRGLTEQGNNDMKTASMMDPSHPEVVAFSNRSFVKSEHLYKESIRLFTQKKYKESLLSLNHAIHITAEDIKLLIMKSKIHRVLNELQLAYESILKAKAQFESSFKDSKYPVELPTDIKQQINLILNEMAINYAMKGEYDKSILIFTNIIKNEKSSSHPNDLLNANHKYYINRGDCYRALNRLNDAVDDYLHAHELKPKEWEIATRLSITYYLIGVEYFNHSLYEETEKELTHAIKYNPKVSEYYVVRGKTRYYQSNFAAAYKDFKKAFELNSTNEEVKHWIAQFDVEDTKKKSQHQQQQQHQFGNSTGSVTHSGGNSNNNSNNRSRHRKSQSAPVVNSKNRIVTELPRAISSSYDADNTLKLDVTSEDIVQMLLHPQKAARLPTMKLSLKSHQDFLSSQRGVGRSSSNNNNNSTSTSSSRGPINQSIDPLLTLPPIDQCTPMQKAYHGSIDLQDKTARFHSKLNEKHEFSRGPLWGLVETAKELAFHRAHPGGYATSNISSSSNNATHKKNDKKNSSDSSSSNNNKMVKSDKKPLAPHDTDGDGDNDDDNANVGRDKLKTEKKKVKIVEPKDVS